MVKRKIQAAAVVVCLLVAGLAYGLPDDYTAGLKGLRSLQVFIELQVGDLNLTESDVLRDVWLKLELAGIEVLGTGTLLPQLVVNVLAFDAGETWVVTFGIKLLAPVFVTFDWKESRTFTAAQLWSSPIRLLSGPESTMARRVRDNIKDRMDYFLLKYVRANRGTGTEPAGSQSGGSNETVQGQVSQGSGATPMDVLQQQIAVAGASASGSAKTATTPQTTPAGASLLSSTIQWDDPSGSREVRFHPEPDLPVGLGEQGVDYRVGVRFTVTPEGLVSGARIINNSGVTGLDQAVIAAIRTWRFAAAPGAADVRVSIIYEIRRLSSAPTGGTLTVAAPAGTGETAPEADVAVRLTVSASGAVTAARVVASSGCSSVDQQVEDAVRQYVFEPLAGATGVGQTVVRFRLKGEFSC